MLLDQCYHLSIFVRPTKRVKEARTWSDGKVSKTEAEGLNRSEQVDENSLTNGNSQVYVSDWEYYANVWIQ